MSTTFTQLQTQVSRDVRDPGNATWTTTEIGDLINLGIDDYGRLHPREVVSAITAVAPATSVPLPSPLTSLFRVDVYDTAGTKFLRVLPPTTWDGPEGGWELHAGTLSFPPSPPYILPDNIKCWGYATYTQLVNGTDVTDLDTEGIDYVRAWCQNEILSRLLNDRATFQQWQQQSSATDTSFVWLFRVMGSSQRKLDAARSRVRLIRRKA